MARESGGLLVLRNVLCDWYMTPKNIAVHSHPNSIRNNTNNKTNYAKKPIIRMFGCTSEGRKCCAHISGCLPYLIVPCPVEHPDPAFLAKFQQSTERALTVARATQREERINPNPGSNNHINAGAAARPTAVHVHSVQMTSAVPFYGYSTNRELFLKILLFSPHDVKLLSDLLRNARVEGLSLQPYEVHLPYLLQFFIDQGIYGMDLVHFSNVNFRSEKGSDPIIGNAPTKQSTCELEFDCDVTQIMRQDSADAPGSGDARLMANPGLRFIWRDERARHAQRGETIAVNQSQERPPGVNEERDELEQKYHELLAKILRETKQKDQSSPADASFAVSSGGHPINSATEPVLAKHNQLVDAVNEQVNPCTSNILNLAANREPIVDTSVEDEQNELVEDVEQGNRDELEMSQRWNPNLLDPNEDFDPFSAASCSTTFAQLDGADDGEEGDSSDSCVSMDFSDKEEEQEASTSVRPATEPIPRVLDDELSRASMTSTSNMSWTKAQTSNTRLTQTHCAYKDTAVFTLKQLPPSASELRAEQSLKRKHRPDMQSTLPDVPIKVGDESHFDEGDAVGYGSSQESDQSVIIEASNSTNEHRAPAKLTNLRRVSQLCAAQPVHDAETACTTNTDVANGAGALNVTSVQSAAAVCDVQGVHVLCMELHCKSRGQLWPDPVHDPISAVFYCLADVSQPRAEWTTAALIHDHNVNMASRQYTGLDSVQYVDTELQLIDLFVKTVRTLDPDMICGFDIQRASWGYLLERGDHLKLQLCRQLSRVPDDSVNNRFSVVESNWAMCDINIVGRIVLNLWRVLRHELTLRSYTFGEIMHAVLGQRVPAYSHATLTKYWVHSKMRRSSVRYYVHRVFGLMSVVAHCDLISRTSELARLFGIQFYDVLSRGSQYRVESMLLRLTRTQGYLAVSPSPMQRRRMAAAESIPLNLEPESAFYKDPVLVLDFQSLYPSMMIAYNYCYSTCLGKINMITKAPECHLGCVRYWLPVEILQSLSADDIHISPSGVAFVKANRRKGVLPTMVEELLNTRLMVKKCMQMYKHEKASK